MNPAVDKYIARSQRWSGELAELREIILHASATNGRLTEELKWGVPCYTYDGANIVLMHVFKAYCALLFFKGALMKDEHGILVQQTKNTQATRQVRFTAADEITGMAFILKNYIREAIDVEKAGLKVNYRKTTEYPIPEEFKVKLDKIPALKRAFGSLTPGRQRAYLLYFSGAKQSSTRSARVEKHMKRILEGEGLDD
jgi:uncharacterized protein YdeI (YjbR/CyaY-like superfamily)